MINPPAILIASGASIMILLILLSSYRKTIRYNMLDYKLFSIMIFFALSQSIIEPLSFFIEGNVKLLPFIYITNSLLLINTILFAFVWTMYVDYKILGDVSRLKKRYPFIAIPALIICIGSIVNLFVPVFYRITSEFVYERTSLSPVLFITNYLYLGYAVVLTYKYRNKVNKYLFMPIIIFMIPIIVASITQFIFYGYSLIWLGTAIALNSLYNNVQNEASYIDPLSGLFTRQYLTSYLNQHMKEGSGDNKIMGIMLDIDHFKVINDTYGHFVGDEAITSAGEILRDSVSNNSIVARYGGDEFVIICRNGELEDIKKIIDKINELAEELNHSNKHNYLLSFSSGYAKCDNNDDIDSFLKKLDVAMYINKKQKESIKKLEVS